MISKLIFILLSPLLFLLSLIYGCVVTTKNLLFNLGLKKTKRLSKPVISVGNISVGGSGKTALVLEILELYPDLCVLTRGYKSKATQTKQNPIFVDVTNRPEFFGDEPSLLKDKNPEALIVIDPNRHRGGEFTLKQNPNIQGFLMDDGFQHRILHRDLNVILFDMEAYHNKRGLLPLGHFREPFQSLKRADYVLMTKWNTYSEIQIEVLKQKISKYVSDVELLSTEIASLQNSALHKMNSKSVILFSGLGQPEIFQSDILRAFPDLKILKHKKYPDHYSYSSKDIQELLDLAKQNNSALLCSEKDYIKVRALDVPLDQIFWTVQKVQLSPGFRNKLEITLKNN